MLQVEAFQEILSGRHVSSITFKTFMLFYVSTGFKAADICIHTWPSKNDSRVAEMMFKKVYRPV